MTQEERQARIDELNAQIEEAFTEESDIIILQECLQNVYSAGILMGYSINDVKMLVEMMNEHVEIARVIYTLCKCYNMKCEERKSDIENMYTEIVKLEEEEQNQDNAE